jgi:signal transduction histidine kinase
MSENGTLEVLLVEDNPVDAVLVTGLLTKLAAPRFLVTRAGTLQQSLQLLQQQRFDVILLDLMLPDSARLDTLHRVLEQAHDVPIVVLTGLDDEATALDALRHGAQDFLIKGEGLGERLLAKSIRYAVERKRAELEIRQLNSELERKKAESELRSARRLAAIGTMAAGIAHEINNPIAAALNSAQAALRFKDDPDDATLLEECLHNVLRSAERCSQIVSNVLTFARQEQAEKKWCNLNQVLRSAREATLDYAALHHATIELATDDNLPQVRINAVAIEQLLVNLIHNSVEAGDGVQITLRTEKTTAGVRVSVEDNGPGITPEQKERAFDPFYSTRYDEGGTGLGLSIAHGIVQGHGGSIEIDGAPGWGTTVTVDLPIGGEDVKMNEPPPRP